MQVNLEVGLGDWIAYQLGAGDEDYRQDCDYRENAIEVQQLFEWRDAEAFGHFLLEEGLGALHEFSMKWHACGSNHFTALISPVLVGIIQHIINLRQSVPLECCKSSSRRRRYLVMY